MQNRRVIRRTNRRRSSKSTCAEQRETKDHGAKWRREKKSTRARYRDREGNIRRRAQQKRKGHPSRRIGKE